MASPSDIKTLCECHQHAVLALPDNEEARETKDSFNNVPSIHEIDEDESEPEETATAAQPNPASAPCPDYNIVSESKNDNNNDDDDDDESAYTGESFCSDDDNEESPDDSEITSVTLGSLRSLSPLHLVDPRHDDSPREQQDTEIEDDWKDDSLLEDERSSLNDGPPSRATSSGCARSKRWNMSFTDEQMRKIGRENELLLRKIMAQQRPRHRIVDQRAAQRPSRPSSSAINRRKLQKKIENDNMMLLQRIQQVKPCVFANASRMGCRLTFL